MTETRRMRERNILFACASVTRFQHQLGLKHGAVTKACVSPIAPALPVNNMRIEVKIMKKLLLASAGVLALGGVANANGFPPMLQNVQDLSLIHI